MNMKMREKKNVTLMKKMGTSLPEQTLDDIRSECLGMGVSMRKFATEQVRRFFNKRAPVRSFHLYETEHSIPIGFPFDEVLRSHLVTEARQRRMRPAALLREILLGHIHEENKPF